LSQNSRVTEVYTLKTEHGTLHSLQRVKSHHPRPLDRPSKKCIDEVIYDTDLQLHPLIAKPYLEKSVFRLCTIQVASSSC